MQAVVEGLSPEELQLLFPELFCLEPVVEVTRFLALLKPAPAQAMLGLPPTEDEKT